MRSRFSPQKKAERDFALSVLADGIDPVWIGRSSKAMLVAAMQGAECSSPSHWPIDEGDLSRCEEMARRAPEHLRDRMTPMLARFRRHVAEGSLYCRGCDNSIDHYSTRDHLCESCQARGGSS